ncbi:MAG: DUF4956 domain-containing protein [Spirochaetales bacterium]|nr:DUF4956 domain-containing protein [Candidatus Physcosoma equi]
MTFKDLFTSDMLSRVTAVSLSDMVLGLVLAFLLGSFIYYVYRKTFNGVLYSASFGLTLIALTMISSLLIMAVSSNIVLSLGMVGALSIVRFRTAIKEPLDIAFLFWSISAGIILATGMIPLAVFGSVAIGIMLLVFANRSGKDNPYILVVHLEDSDGEKSVMNLIEKNTERHLVKGKTFSKDGKEELTVEVQLKDGESSFVRSIHEAKGVQDVVMVSYNGDYMQ